MSNARNLASYVTSLIALASSPAGQSVPTGTVKDFAGPEAKVPSGYLLCAGQAISRTTYAALYAIIGTTYGAGDGSTTFNLPDTRGRVIMGKDDMGGTAANRVTAVASGIAGATLGASGGVEAVTLTGAQSGTPAHSHTASNAHTLATAAAGSHSHTVNNGVQSNGASGGFQQDAGSSYITSITTDTAPAHTHTITGGITTTITAATAANAASAHSNTQPSIVFNKIIKT